MFLCVYTYIFLWGWVCFGNVFIGVCPLELNGVSFIYVGFQRVAGYSRTMRWAMWRWMGVVMPSRLQRVLCLDCSSMMTSRPRKNTELPRNHTAGRHAQKTIRAEFGWHAIWHTYIDACTRLAQWYVDNYTLTCVFLPVQTWQGGRRESYMVKARIWPVYSWRVQLITSPLPCSQKPSSRNCYPTLTESLSTRGRSVCESILNECHLF